MKIPQSLFPIWFAFFFILLCPGISAGDETSLSTIKVGPDIRSYKLERIGTIGAQERPPIIVFLYGSQTDIRQPISPRFDVAFDHLQPSEPALVVRPQGFDREWSVTGETFGWRRWLWRFVTGRRTDRPDEIAFIDALVAHLIADEHGDPARVYVVGVSSGGFMAMRLACSPHQPFAAYAALLATAEAPGMAACKRLPAVSLLLLASTTDPQVLYRGGEGDGGMRRLSVPETVVDFAQRDHCTTRTETPLPPADIAVPSTVSLINYGNCTDGHEVLFYRVDGSGHSVPSKRPIEPGGWVENGARNRDFEAAEAVWTFFSSQKLTTSQQNALAR